MWKDSLSELYEIVPKYRIKRQMAALQENVS